MLTPEQAYQSALADYRRANWPDAERLCRIALQGKSDFFEALHLLGIIAAQTGRLQEALELLSSAASADRNNAEAQNNLGTVLRRLKRPEEALKSFKRALTLRPSNPEAHSNMGNALADLGRQEDALRCYDRAIALSPSQAQLFNNRGTALVALGRHAEALGSFDKAAALDPVLADSHRNRANVLVRLRRLKEALASAERAVALRHDSAEALFDLANILTDLGRHDRALESFERAIALRPDYAEAFLNRGNTLTDLGRHAEALASFRRAIALSPDLEFLMGMCLHAKMKACDWEGFQDARGSVEAGVRADRKVTPPFAFISFSDAPDLQRRAAEIWARSKYPSDSSLGPIGRPVRGDQIRIGYFSADFRRHAVSYLAAELFERHDKSRFELTAFAFGPPTADETRDRVAAAFDRFVDVGDRSDAEVAALARSLGIDIAVDLGGYTANCRTGIFALRAAPVQAAFLGYPGTLGADYMDYLIADATVIPPSHRQHYAEQIVCLPNSFLPNDTRLRPIADTVFARVDLGLPDDGCVFCCFNNSYKILPEVFDGWMRILGRVPGSVLWLRTDNEDAMAGLRKQAERRHIDGGRLVFAGRMLSLAEHLARHRSADLFLDTFPYNAHTTASDALWAGLPVLTRMGECFASRVAASLLHAIGLPELITSTAEEYEAAAVELATHPGRLASIRAKLAGNRLSTPLFDTRALTKHIEQAYAAMYERYHAGIPPGYLGVPA